MIYSHIMNFTIHAMYISILVAINIGVSEEKLFVVNHICLISIIKISHPTDFFLLLFIIKLLVEFIIHNHFALVNFDHV